LRESSRARRHLRAGAARAAQIGSPALKYRPVNFVNQLLTNC
jgi:hypothetical protein